MNYLLLDSWSPRIPSFLVWPEARLGSEGAWVRIIVAAVGVCGTGICSIPPAPPAILSGPQNGGEQMAWGGWGGRPSVPSPPLSLEPRGMGGGCGPLQSGSSPSIFLEGAEELVVMETEKRQEGCREVLRSG